MALYEELCNLDVITPIASQLESRQMSISPETRKIEIKGTSLSPRPWLYGAVDPLRRCQYWENIHFKLYGFIPKACLGCWKIAYSPPTLDHVFKVYDLLIKLAKRKIPNSNYPFYGKVGAEKRLYTGNAGGYTAMFYTPLGEDIEFAQELRNIIERRLRAEVDSEASPILKRGCTEFERKFYPSTDWDKFYENGNWHISESLVDSILPSYHKIARESDYAMMEVHVKRSLIEYAFEHGDSTYLNFTEGPMLPPLVNYATTDFDKDDLKWSKFDPMENTNGEYYNRSISQESKASSDGSEEQGNDEQGRDGDTSESSRIIRLSELQ